MSSALRVAVASSGLGHIRRGIESWAEDLGNALQRRGVSVTLFQGGGAPSEPWKRTLACMRRFEAPAARTLSITRALGGWRYGMGSEYEIEQTTFSLSLWRAVRSRFDILHVQDPGIARIMDRLNRCAASKPKVILAHGTEEPVEVLRKYSFLQHLAPNYRDDYESQKSAGQWSFAVPNFVDTTKFQPGEKPAARRLFGLPDDALVVLSVAALKKHHKRCDYLIREFAEFRNQCSTPAVLVLAGAREKETPEIIELGRSLLGESVTFFEALDRERLTLLYRAADIFAIASLHEMMPIALLEALASGLPITCNDTPTLRWMAGRAACPGDISMSGGLVRQWSRLGNLAVRQQASAEARAQAEATFSEPVVIEQILQMYHQVVAA